MSFAMTHPILTTIIILAALFTICEVAESIASIWRNDDEDIL